MDTQRFLTQLRDAVSTAAGIDRDDLFSYDKSFRYTMARGVFFLLARERGVRYATIGEFSHRDHSTCVNGKNRYQGYCDTKDKVVCDMVSKVKDIMNSNSNE